MKVFVIEDNPVYNDYVCNLLKKDSFDTMSAYNLATAKKLLAKSEVDDIVVADLRLPDGESIPALTQQTDDYATPHRQYLLGRIRRIGNRNICTHDT